MSVLFFILSIAFILFISYATQIILRTRLNSSIPSRIYRLLHFVRIAPIVAVLILGILTLAILHNKAGIRLSHAWYVAQFWAYMTFLYCGYMVTKKKVFLFPMFLSFVLAAYSTPLFHFEKVFIGHNIIVSAIFATLMFITLWLSTTKVLLNIKKK